jgi:hypothetical protein
MKNGSYYYLFINRGSCCQGVNSTSYRIQVGRSASITGPYLDKNGNDLNNGGGTNLVVTTGRYIGPGHFGYGQGKVTYHFYDGNDSGNAKLRITTMSWSNGWPVVSGSGARVGIDEQLAEDDLKAELSEIVSFFPNPVRENILTVRTRLQEEATVQVKLTDSRGNEVYTKELGICTADALDHEINISTLKKGIYIIHLTKQNPEGKAKTISSRVSIE